MLVIKKTEDHKQKVFEKKKTSGNFAEPEKSCDFEYYRSMVWPPCRYHCPVHADVQRYIDLSAAELYRDAALVIRESLPLAAVCGRVCPHPCENHCRRGDVDDSVAIREIKRFVVEHPEGIAIPPFLSKPDPEKPLYKTAVIGAGPSGLSAALALAQEGVEVSIYEKESVSGGIPAWSIPAYRLPPSVSQLDVHWVKKHGVVVKNGIEIGRDINLHDLTKDYDSVIIASGLTKSRTIPVKGMPDELVTGALDFLKDLKKPVIKSFLNMRHGTDASEIGVEFDKKTEKLIREANPVKKGASVAVVGGGNVAFDAARSAVRLGYSDVFLICLENEEELPALPEELKEAREEGIEILFRRSISEAVSSDDEVNPYTLNLKSVLSVFDENGAFAPQFDPSDSVSVKVSRVITAVGQAPDLTYASGSELRMNQSGRPEAFFDTGQTSLSGVFVCGEAVSRPGTVVEACASGIKTAGYVYKYLSDRTPSGTLLKNHKSQDTSPPYLDKLPDVSADAVVKTERESCEVLPASNRREDFTPVSKTYKLRSFLNETQRCMNCGSGAYVVQDKCAGCLTCERICPFDAPYVSSVAVIDPVKCQACGLCITLCPANAIISKAHPVDRFRHAAEKAVEKGAVVISYVSSFHLMGDFFYKDEPRNKTVYLPDMMMLDRRDILSVLERGAEKVRLYLPRPPLEKYPESYQRALRKVKGIFKDFEALGLDKTLIEPYAVTVKDRKMFTERIML